MEKGVCSLSPALRSSLYTVFAATTITYSPLRACIITL